MCLVRSCRFVGLVLLVGVIGCSGGEAPPADGDATNSTAQTTTLKPSTEVLRFAKPEEVVTEFLTALKSGDQPRSTAMLTVKAQQEMAKTEAVIRPPGSPTAGFEVTEVEYLGENKEAAQVLSIWNDTEEDGTPTQHEIVWILRHENEGWAVAGFATKVFPDRPPLILNFEDPMDLQRKRTAVDAEIARRQEGTVTQ